MITHAIKEDYRNPGSPLQRGNNVRSANIKTHCGKTTLETHKMGHTNIYPSAFVTCKECRKAM